MKENTSINKELFKFIDESRNTGVSDNNMLPYLFLYFLSCSKEGIDLKLNTEKRQVFDDNNLFGKEEGKLELYNEYYSFVLKNVPESKRIFFKINNVFNKILSINHTVNFLQKYLEDNPINRLAKLVSEDDFAIKFEELFKLIARIIKKNTGEFELPIEIGELMIQLADLDKKASVFNPFSGLATFGICLKESQEYLGHEINDFIWAVSVLRINAHSRDKFSELLITDTLDSWPSKRKFDLVLANPPFRFKLSKKQQSKFSGERYLESFFINQGLKLLKQNGKLLSIVPNAFLSNYTEKNLRKFLVDQDLLEAVISLPGGLLNYTNIPFTILLINKNKKHKNDTLMIDASKYVNEVSKFNKVIKTDELILDVKKILEEENNLVNESQSGYKAKTSYLQQFVSKDIIAEKDYYLNINRYNFDYDEIKGTPLKKIINIIKPISYKKAISYLENLEVISNENKYPFKHISTKDLKIDLKDFSINVSDLHYKSVKYGKFINTSSYVVSMIGNNLKPSFLEIKDEVIHLSNEIVAFTLNEDLVDPNWFIKELNSTRVKEQQMALVTGIIPRLNKEDFLNLKINLPTLKEQKEEISKILGLERQVDDLESDIIQQNSYLRHTVAGPLSDLDHALNNIDTILNNISQNQMPQILNSKVSEEHLYTLEEYLQDSKKYVSLILNTVKSKLNSTQKIEQKKLVKLNLREHLENYVKRKFETKKQMEYILDYDYDREFFSNKANSHFDFILGNKELINTLLDNIIDNAVKHAFIEGESNKIEIYVWGYDEEAGEESIYFSISNTGKPLPENINIDILKKRGYSKGVKSGDGFGLWLVNEILKKHKADWNIVDEHREYNSYDNEYTTFKGLKIPSIKIDTVTKFSFNFPILKK